MICISGIIISNVHHWLIIISIAGMEGATLTGFLLRFSVSGCAKNIDNRQMHSGTKLLRKEGSDQKTEEKYCFCHCDAKIGVIFDY